MAVALFARRNVLMRDGVITTDRPVEERLFATDELSKLKSVDELAVTEG